MAKKRKKKTEPVPSIAAALSAYRGVGWAVVAGVWVLLAAALLSYAPADAPTDVPSKARAPSVPTHDP